MYMWILSTTYKYNDQVPDHEKIVYNMNKSHSQATYISPPKQPDYKCAIPENVLIISIVDVSAIRAPN